MQFIHTFMKIQENNDLQKGRNDACGAGIPVFFVVKIYVLIHKKRGDCDVSWI